MPKLLYQNRESAVLKGKAQDFSELEGIIPITDRHYIYSPFTEDLTQGDDIIKDTAKAWEKFCAAANKIHKGKRSRGVMHSKVFYKCPEDTPLYSRSISLCDMDKIRSGGLFTLGLIGHGSLEKNDLSVTNTDLSIHASSVRVSAEELFNRKNHPIFYRLLTCNNCERIVIYACNSAGYKEYKGNTNAVFKDRHVKRNNEDSLMRKVFYEQKKVRKNPRLTVVGYYFPTKTRYSENKKGIIRGMWEQYVIGDKEEEIPDYLPVRNSGIDMINSENEFMQSETSSTFSSSSDETLSSQDSYSSLCFQRSSLCSSLWKTSSHGSSSSNSSSGSSDSS